MRLLDARSRPTSPPPTRMAARSSNHSAGLSASPADSRLCAILASMFLLLASAFSAACLAWPVNAFDGASARGPDCPGTAITP